jgi:hypothetical protein
LVRSKISIYKKPLTVTYFNRARGPKPWYFKLTN